LFTDPPFKNNRTCTLTFIFDKTTTIHTKEIKSFSKYQKEKSNVIKLGLYSDRIKKLSKHNEKLSKHNEI